MKRSISRHLLEPHSPSSDPVVEGTIACPICHSIYTPSRLHAYLLQKPPIALESAFISMCHFCFRCRRPSCPNCWDAVHLVCGQCTSETHVPFRLKTPPLEGISYYTSTSGLPMARPSIPLSSPPLQADVHSDRLQDAFLPGERSNTVLNHSPSSLQSSGTIVTSSPTDIDKIATRPDPTGTRDVETITTRPDPSTTADIDRIATRPDPTRTLNVAKTAARSARSVSKKRKFAPILLSVLLIMVFLLVAIAAAALISTNVNIFIYRLLHIDVRGQLILLWHFLHHLF